MAKKAKTQADMDKEKAANKRFKAALNKARVSSRTSKKKLK